MQIQREQQQRKLQLDNAQFIQWLLLLLLLSLVLVVVPVVLLLIVVVVVVVVLVVLRRRRLVHTLQFCYIFFCSSFFYLKPLLFLPRSFFFCTSLCNYFPCAWALEAPPPPPPLLTYGKGEEWWGVGLAVGAGAGTDNQPERGVEQLEHCNYLFVLVTLGVWGIPTNPSGCRTPYTPPLSLYPSSFCFLSDFSIMRTFITRFSHDDSAS